MRASAQRRIQRTRNRLLNQINRLLVLSFDDIRALFTTKSAVTDDNIRAAIASLEKEGLIESDDGLWYLTHAGMRRARRALLAHRAPPIGGVADAMMK